MNSILDSYINGNSNFHTMGPKLLSKTYNWGLPKPPKGVLLDENLSVCSQTISLKKQLQILWYEHPERRIELTQFIVKEWGGIKTNSRNTLTAYAKLSANYLPQNISGVASWSKVLGIIDPDKFAIYDARVAVSLNALQLLSKPETRYFFPYLQGRNNIVGNSTKKIGFSQRPEFKKNGELMKNWQRIPRNETYTHYLELLDHASKGSGYSVYEIEMALFADAENLAIACSQKFQVPLS